MRWVAVAAATALVLLAVVLFQKGPYFKNRVAFTLFQRRGAQRTASDLATLLPRIPPDSRLFIYQRRIILLAPVPRPLRLPKPPLRRQAYNCILSDSQRARKQTPPKTPNIIWSTAPTVPCAWEMVGPDGFEPSTNGL